VGKRIVAIAACVLFSALSLAAKGEQIFQGEITDSKCAALGGHASMLVSGETNAECTIACVKMGAQYVLSDLRNKIVYRLDDQKKPKSFAALNVIVVGTLDQASGTIHVVDIVRDIPPKVKRAKTVSIVCDNCPRAMAKARRAAFEELTTWRRFTILPDPAQADLIVLVSANPYLGDYVTREGPDKRPVLISITYMDVVDPHTGASLWGDSARSGSWMVAKSTKALIDEFRAELEVDESSTERQLFIARHTTLKAGASPGK
jgi:hypothetical protein